MNTDDEFEIGTFLPYLLNQAGEAAGQEFQRYYKDRYGMLRSEWRVLFHLGRFGALTAREICDRARLHKTKTSRAVAALEARRFLKRAVMVHDRRQEQLTLSAAGQAAYKDLAAIAAQFDARLMAQFSRTEAATLRRCLQRLMDG
ncbi:MAG: MarR family winged helix-turn-helix transcriptional regulator [Paracoccaceae bacterium]